MVEELIDMEELRITEEDGHVVDVFLKPNTQPYIAKRAELVRCGMSEEDAEAWLLTTPIPLELFYTKTGLFGVESEAVESCDIYNPYSGETIPNDNLIC